MTIDDRAALIDQFVYAWNIKDVDALMNLMTDDCIFHSSVGPDPGVRFEGHADVRRGFEMYLLPSGSATETVMEKPLVGMDFAVTRWTTFQRHEDGAVLETRACDVFEFGGDRIKRKDTYRKISTPVTAS
ncbi:nuclear transport factor 2 family protein [Rhodococcus opacus]|uniref:Uncharacterized protein n=1 Tax=Rhodococcus opacus TaxID=37919 RepID=A0A1B1KFA0_RHOOP|nr:nuclear transport factor 2 family protein [Rhodococcus opacus]ANS31239.1 hypothetical protein R1CP_33080 [Rhodococcus opacus]MBA8961528.1 ketosteroid isomerase-like protein [Rhodococcus opacus]MBP2202608.1 ketosteroid isomerase-like protein [Rhodococcus opacus]MDJ0417712.1 nuclear transport factor 2 family protein [Rhodococcus opacus]WKN55347.1 nuclear transport factor 2 family protein [Rhodococcus opacus]